MTVTSTIIGIRAPLVEFTRTEQWEFELDVNATGSGTDRLLIAFFDNLLKRYIGAWATVDPLPPGKYIFAGAFNPLDAWYPSPIPGILNWTAKVGYIRDSTATITDSKDFKIPRVVDRLCNGQFCVGVSNPYPAPGKEITISGHQQAYQYGCGSRPDMLALYADSMVFMKGTHRGPVAGGKCGDGTSCGCYFCFAFNAPRFEGGYTYKVVNTLVPMESSPIGIWVAAPPACEDYTTKEECEAAGCYWYGNACHSAPPALCEDIITQADCLASGCFWYNNGCHSSPQSFLDKYKKELMLLGGMGVGVVAIMAISRF